MGDWISDVLLFSAGIAGGILICSLAPSFSASKRRRSAIDKARERILLAIKEQHEEEFLHEALQTTQDIRGELDKSLETLRKTLTTVLDPITEQSKHRVIRLSKRIKTN
jgi:hypothetical protein